MLGKKMNWFGLAGSLATFLLIIVSFSVPWWKLTVGDSFVTANASPINTNFNFAGESFTIPLMWALNLSSILSLAAAGVALFAYSVSPLKPFSRTLLGFAYKKPLYSLLVFLVVLIVLTVLIRSVYNLSIPLVGSTINKLSGTLTQNATVTVPMFGEFQWPFWLGVVAAGLSLAARLYHERIIGSPTQPSFGT